MIYCWWMWKLIMMGIYHSVHLMHYGHNTGLMFRLSRWVGHIVATFTELMFCGLQLCCNSARTNFDGKTNRDDHCSPNHFHRPPNHVHGDHRSPSHLHGDPRSPSHLHGDHRSPSHLHGDHRSPSHSYLHHRHRLIVIVIVIVMANDPMPFKVLQLYSSPI